MEPTARVSSSGPGFAAASDVGLRRSGNEDGFLARPPVFVVADGMGGHQAGEVASALALRVVDERLPSDAARDPAAIAGAVEAANGAIWREAHDRPELSGMGTTCTIAVVDGQRIRVAHVGDSRAYLLRGGTLEQLTSDHTLVATMVREGILSDDDAREDDRRHIITRALGAGPDVRVDVSLHDLGASDRLLICSDGLSGQVDDDTIAAVLVDEPDPSTAVDRLIGLANAAGGVDNVTIVLVDAARTVLAAAPASDRPGRQADHDQSAAGGQHRRIWRRVAMLLASVLLALLALLGIQALTTTTPPAPTPSATPSLTPPPSGSGSSPSPRLTPGGSPSLGPERGSPVP